MKYIFIISLMLLASCASTKNPLVEIHMGEQPKEVETVVIKVMPKLDLSKVKYGKDNDEIKMIQKLLVSKGAGFNPTGYYGSRTHDAVVSFNYVNNIRSDDVTERTWVLLNSSDSKRI